MLVECENCQAHYQTDPSGNVQQGCMDCGGQLRPYRSQPSPVGDEGTLRNMVDSDTQVDQGGNPLGEGTIMGRDGERPFDKRDNYTHGHLLATLVTGEIDMRGPYVYDGIPCPNCNQLMVPHETGAVACPYCEHYQGVGWDEDPHTQRGFRKVPEAFERGMSPAVIDQPGYLGPPHQGKTADLVTMPGQQPMTEGPYQEVGQHHLKWEPGNHGRGLIIEGRPHTWNAYHPDTVFQTNDTGLHHGQYVKSLGISPESVDWNTGVEIRPTGEVEPLSGRDVSPYIAADPRLKPLETSNEPFDFSFMPVHETIPNSYERTSNMDLYAPWTHEADVNFDKGPLEDYPAHTVVVHPGPGGIHSAHHKWLDFLDAHINGESARDLGPGGVIQKYGLPTNENFRQPVTIHVHSPEHIPAIKEQLEQGGFQPVPQMIQLGQRMQRGEIPPAPGIQMAPAQPQAQPQAPVMARIAGPAILEGAGALLGGEAFGGGLMGGIAGALAKGALFRTGENMLGVGNKPQVQQQPEQEQIQPMLAALLVSKGYDTPTSNPDVGTKHGDDPEKVDTKEFNDKDQSLTNIENPNMEDSGASGEDAVRDHAGFGPNSPGLERMQLLMPLVVHYFNSPESGEEDPMIKSLHDLLEQENPGYLDRVTPEHEQAAHEFVKKLGDHPHGVHAKTSILGGDPNDVNRMLQNAVAPQGNVPMPPGGQQQQGHCPCGGVLDGTGRCPQCGQVSGGGVQPQQVPGQMMGAPGGMGAFAHTDILASLVDSANHQGPVTPEQIAAVQQLLLEQGRVEEVPNVPIKPGDYSREMAEIQGNPNVAPQVSPEEQTKPMPPQMAPPGAMPVPGMGQGEPGGQPMQPLSADNVAKRCPKCGSGTTGVLTEDGDMHCHSCGNIWKAGELAKEDVHSSILAAVVADSLNPVDAPAADRNKPRDFEGEQDSSLTWKDSNGQELVAGREYEMKSPSYQLPDVIRVNRKKPDGLDVIIMGTFANDPNSIQAPAHISREDMELENITFAPVAESQEDRGNEPPTGGQMPGLPPQQPTTDEYTNQYPTASVASIEDIPERVENDCCPKCGHHNVISSMSSPTTVMHECYRCGPEHIWETNDDTPGLDVNASSRAWLNEDDGDEDFALGMERARAMREAGQTSRDIRSIAENDSRSLQIKDYLAQEAIERQERTSGRKFTPREQKELIDENGVARNRDLLDLEGTHYQSRTDWTGKANAANVPEEHLLLGV